MRREIISSKNQIVSRVSGGSPYEFQQTSDSNTERTLVGKNIDDCRAKLYNMYGSHYRITGQKQILKGGILGWMQKELLEVRFITEPEPSFSPASPAVSNDSFQQKRDDLLGKIVGNGTGDITTTIQISKLDKKLEDTQKKLDEKMNQILKATNADSKPASIVEIENLLRENEFTFEYINGITTRLRSELTMEQLDDFKFVQRTVIDWIGGSIKIAPNVPHKYPHVIILVGPTGVGKTTTIAKMAGTLIKVAKDKNEPRPVIKMITIDHTRVGAEEQLRRFGDIMMIDVQKAESASDVKTIFDSCKDNLDVLFIDTPGYSPNDHENIGKMTKILEVQGIHPDIYLAFSAATKAMDLTLILRNYESCNYSSVIITKWDETSAIGNVVSVLSKKGKMISYITDGQQVPKKLERATVVRFLTNLVDFEIDREHIDEKFPEDK